jgi:hypothetical protein
LLFVPFQEERSKNNTEVWPSHQRYTQPRFQRRRLHLQVVELARLPEAKITARKRYAATPDDRRMLFEGPRALTSPLSPFSAIDLERVTEIVVQTHFNSVSLRCPQSISQEPINRKPVCGIYSNPGRPPGRAPLMLARLGGRGIQRERRPYDGKAWLCRSQT